MNKERLKARREALNMSQSELARMLGIDPQRISAYECGTRKAGGDVIAAIADALQCSADYLLGRVPTP